MPMQGLTVASLKKAPSLLVLHAATAAGGIWAAYYIARMSFKGPDVCFDKRDKYPNQHYDRKQSKFARWDFIRNYKNLEKRPEF